jgi:branched-chain amino acid transport system permease protein
MPNGALRWTLFVACAVLPAWLWPQGAVLGYLAQTAALVVLALSYNLQLGTTGLLSFGHAAVAGVGAFAAAHWFNRVGAPLPLLPLVGGVAGAAFGCVAGLLATRRAGTVFAMITLGIGECVAAAASVPAWFGGVGGVPIDRAGGTPWGGWQFGAPTHAYALIAAWCIGSALAMYALTRTPLARLANAVRDNLARRRARHRAAPRAARDGHLRLVLRGRRRHADADRRRDRDARQRVDGALRDRADRRGDRRHRHVLRRRSARWC